MSRLNLWAFAVAATLLLVLPADIAEFADVPTDGLLDWAKSFALFFLIPLVCQALLVGLVAINRWVFALLYPLLSLLCYVMLYFYLTLRVTLSPTLVGLALTNDWATSSDFLTLPAVLTALAALALGAAMAWVRWRFVRMPAKRVATAAAILFAAILSGLLNFSPRLARTLGAKLPFSALTSTVDYFRMRHQALEVRPAFDQVDARCAADSLSVVLVIGESLRSDHLGINGYRRNTTPCLAAEPNLVSFTDISTEAFHTAIAIPQLLTRADSSSDSIGYVEPSFITLFRRAGFRTDWIANQEPIASFAYFTAEPDSLISVFGGHSLYSYDLWLDEALLPPLAERLAAPNPLSLTILHTIGSHWYTESHYTPPFRRFTPTLTSRNVNSNLHQQIVNSYDNTVCYADWFLSQVIAMLRNRRAILIFCSDHGEALGEDGRYLHAAASGGASKVAAFVWWSDAYARAYPDKVAALRANRARPADTGFLFHTILDAADISTPVLIPDQSFATIP